MSQSTTAGESTALPAHHQLFSDLSQEPSSDDTPVPSVHIAILGTGFSGLGMAIRLKQDGQDDFLVLERASDIGGTWRDNTYPGCACDVPSHLYSFSFALNPNWSRTYSSQQEIRQYLRDCAERFGILPHVQWNCELLHASWHEEEQRWHLMTSTGPVRANILILGNGPLSEPSLPPIPGIADFKGELFHSARWRHDYDLTGKRVAVIGTGASSIQFVPRIQSRVEHLTLFQRTPPWIVPRMDQPIPASVQKLYRRFPFLQRLRRGIIYWQRELTALGLVYRPDLLESGMKIAREHLAAQVADPVLREKLTPNYTMGCKRILISDDFYPALTQPNVEVVTDPIREVRAHSIVMADGSEHMVDAIICGTGFHVTDTQFSQYIKGRDGKLLAESWQDGPHAYLGTTVAGFPNLFLMIGPNTGLGHNSMVFMIESQISYLLDCFRIMKRRGWQTIEVRPEAEQAFNDKMQQRMQKTVWVSGCASWYLDAQGHNTTLWPGFSFEYRRQTSHFDAQNYTMTTRQAAIARR